MVGYFWKKVPKPKQTKEIWMVWPNGIPNKWGMVLLKPNLIPEAVSIALFGPGVTNITK